MIISLYFIIINFFLGGTVEGFDASARPLSLSLSLFPAFWEIYSSFSNQQAVTSNLR